MMTRNRLDIPPLHRRLLRQVFNAGQATRQSLVEELGCTLLTVSKAVTALLNDGLLVIDGTLSSSAGRRKSLLKLNPVHRMCVCADIGYGSVKLGLVRLNGEVEKKFVIPRMASPMTEGIDEECLLRAMDALIEEAGHDRVLGLGVGISGMVDFDRGRVLFCPNISGFDDRPLAEELSRRFGLPVLLDTSARCMAMGEYIFGASRGVRDQIFLSLGTGSIASGILADGRLYRSAAGFAGEIGHTCVRPGANAGRCTCGGYDCLEQFATVQMLCAHITEALNSFAGYSQAKRLLGHERVTLEWLGALLATGDPIVTEQVQRALDDIATVLTGAVNLLTPSQVIVGGRLVQCLPDAVEQLRNRVLSSCLTPLRTRLEIRPSQLGEDAALRGAAGMLVLNYLDDV